MSHLARFFDSVARPHIAVVGDVVLDEYVFGEVGRISPEAPIPVLNVSRREFRAGGAGSVVGNLAHLEATVSVYGVCGVDSAGNNLRELLADDRVRLAGLVEEPERRTTVKSRLIGFVQSANRAMQQIARVDDEQRTQLTAASRERLVESFRQSAHEFDAVLISDYDKGLITSELLSTLRAFLPSNVPVMVDPARREDYSLYKNSFLMCPNRFEAQQASGMECDTIQGCRDAAQRLADDLDIGAVALTMDSDGIYLFEKGQTDSHFPTRSRRVTDVTGAGDMVLSVLGLVVAAGGTMDQAVELANVAAGLEIRRMGVSPLSRQEISEALLEDDRPGMAKVKTVQDLGRIARAAHGEGRTVVFTNGCFDLFHLGHHHLLTGASEEGELLIVAVNSDESVRRLNKGPGRPVFSQEERLRVIAGLEVVDYVVCFNEDTPIRLLEALKPDVLVKGGEYVGEGAVGGSYVESYGGRVVYVPHLPGFSTTALIEKWNSK